MKSVITAVVLAAIASPSFASWNNTGSVSWNGTTSATLFSDGCVFKDQTNGTMTFDGDTAKWTTTVAASIKVKSRGRNNIKVTSDNKLRTNSGEEVAPATVNYNGNGITSSIQTNKAGAVKNINTNELSLGNANRANGATISTFTIGGDAAMAADDVDKLDNSTTYKINHTVTCTQ